jgi:hypothetical protein
MPVADIDGCNDNCSHSCGNVNEWITRKVTRLCAPLPKSLIFHLKRFEYSIASGRVEKLPGRVDVPAELDVTSCSTGSGSTTTVQPPGHPSSDDVYRYRLTGAIVHVDPKEDEDDDFGMASEGHYVTFVRSSLPDDRTMDKDGEYHHSWTEIDDGIVRHVHPTDDGDSSTPTTVPAVPDAICGCDVTKSGRAEKGDGGKLGNVVVERRYATLVVYTRVCDGQWR